MTVNGFTVGLVTNRTTTSREASMIYTVGSFTFDSADSTVSGPAEYMKSESYRSTIASIENGTNHVFRAGLEHSPNFETALLVTIQTDFAGWHGLETFNRARIGS